MATASFDFPPLVNPHPRLHDLPTAPTALPPARRVSSESQAPGRASPSPRITRRTPVPFLLEAFPAPPSHIPGTPSSLSPSSILGPSLLAPTTGLLSGAAAPASTPPANGNVGSSCPPASFVATQLSNCNPPPSSPPTGPLPPIPGPSSVPPDVVATHRQLQTVARAVSPAISLSESHRSQSRTEHRPRLSIDMNDPARGRRRQGSLSSLRHPIYPIGERKEAIAEESVETPCTTQAPLTISQSPPTIFGSVGERRSHDQSRGDSPDILRSCLSRITATPVGAGDKPYTEDSITSVDIISDLNAVKSDNEGDGDDQTSHPFPRCPPLPHSRPQSPTDPPSSGPRYGHQPRKHSRSSEYSIHVPSTSEGRAKSPEITQIISATPRPRKRSMPSQSREPSRTRNRADSSRSRQRADIPPVPSCQTVKTAPRVARLSGDDEAISPRREKDGHDSDSSLDLHTPLPQLMLRHGMLSPNSKLLPQLEADPTRLSIMSDLSSSSRISNMSNVSLKSTASTSSKHPKDARDTLQRRVRHRDGRLLRGGIGLTTGLGWSDSEDEDAPSPLTRRVSTLVLSRRASSSSVGSLRSSRSQTSPHPLSRSISHSVLREADEHNDVPDVDEFGYPTHSDVAIRSLPSRNKPVSRVGSVRSMGSSIGRYSTYSNSSATGARKRAGSASESSIYAGSVASKPDSFTSTDGHGGLMPGIREQDDGVTPTRTAFERSSLGSLSGSAADSPCSTASSASLPFPATPESGEDIHQLHPMYNQDKVLPPLPPGAKNSYPRTFSNASLVSTGSRIGVPVNNPKSNNVSATTTPRQSLGDRPPKSSIPAGSRRPSLNGTPRPSLTIPKVPLPTSSAASGLPRPTTPSLSPHPNAGPGYTPRPLKLVNRGAPSPTPTSPAELNQSPVKTLQPGEQLPRPGQVLTYNRNVHDQLKLRTVSLTGSNRGPAPAVSPGGTQTLFMAPSTAGSAPPSSALSSPAATRSHSPLPSPSSGPDGSRPRPRTGTGMLYRTNLSVAAPPASRMRVPSTVSR